MPVFCFTQRLVNMHHFFLKDGIKLLPYVVACKQEKHVPHEFGPCANGPKGRKNPSFHLIIIASKERADEGEDAAAKVGNEDSPRAPGTATKDAQLKG